MTTPIHRPQPWNILSGKVIISILLVLASTVLLAQEKLITNFELVAGSGLLLNTGSGHADDDRLTKFGYSFGVGAYHSFTPSFELNFRALWELKGFKASEPYYNPFTNTNEVLTIERSIRYLTLSVLPTFLVGHRKKMRFSVGGYYSFLQSAKNITTNLDQTGQILNQSSGTSTHNINNDIGLSLSVGYPISITKKNKIVIQIIQTIGVQYFTNSFGYDIRNKVDALVISYTIPNGQ